MLVFTGILAVGCQRGKNAAENNGQYRIALVVKTLNSPFFLDMQKGAEKTAQKLNVNLTVQAAEREIDVDKQMQIVENLIQTQVDAICLVPSGSKELVPAIAKANQANIPVLIVDTKIDPDAAKAEGIRTETFIGSDNFQGGKIAGEYAAKIFSGKSTVAILEGVPGHETSDNRLRGFLQGIKDFPGLKVVASQPANMERDQGFNVTQNILQAHPDLQLVFACNDLMALGALEAVATAGKTGQVKIIGFDAIDEARKEIQAGSLEASIAQHPDEMGRLAMEYAVKVIRKEKIPQYIPTKIELITRHNQ